MSFFLSVKDLVVNGGLGDLQRNNLEECFWKCPLLLHPRPDRRSGIFDPSLLCKLYDQYIFFNFSRSNRYLLFKFIVTGIAALKIQIDASILQFLYARVHVIINYSTFESLCISSTNQMLVL